MTVPVAPSFTELLERPSVRAALSALLLSIAIMAIVDLGGRLQGSGPQLSDCIHQHLDCRGSSFLIGGEVVLQGTESLAVRILSQDLVFVEAWPEGVPYPASGDAVSVLGTYLSNGRVEVTEAALYPLGSVDMWLGLLAVVLWVGALAVFARKQWLETTHDG
jgi:hypothetical protein